MPSLVTGSEFLMELAPRLEHMFAYAALRICLHSTHSDIEAFLVLRQAESIRVATCSLSQNL
jgi:hypothetical protein